MASTVTTGQESQILANERELGMPSAGRFHSRPFALIGGSPLFQRSGFQEKHCAGCRRENSLAHNHNLKFKHRNLSRANALPFVPAVPPVPRS